MDLVRARAQHAAYAAALEAAGRSVQRVPADECFPDCVFIEDTAVVWGAAALTCRMAPHRDGEQAGVLAVLRQSHDVVALPPGATLEGGDVLHTDDATYVGRSSRTNAAGAAALRDFLGGFGREVIEVPVERCLHLKSGATWLGNGTMLVATEWLEPGAFQADHVMATTPGESKAANVIRIADHLLALAGYPATLDAIRNFSASHDVQLHVLEMSEFEKGDGSLTCLSILP